MKQILRFNKVVKYILVLGDLCLLNTIFISLYHVLDTQTLGREFSDSLPQLLVLLNFIYILCGHKLDIILLHERIVRPDIIITHVIRNSLFHGVIFISLLSFANFGTLSVRFFTLFYCIFPACLIIYRLIIRHLIKRYRRWGGNSRITILVGDGENIKELYTAITNDPTLGFRVIGYFAEQPSELLPHSLAYLGHPREVIPFIQHTHVEHVYCGLASPHTQVILSIISYCEKNLIRFFYIPAIRNFLKRRMYFNTLGNIPIFSMYREPLSLPGNQLLKRLFDIIFSLLFLCTLFPIIYIIIGTAIKLSSPGPIFFKQKRSGEDGNVFWCYKFRSMRVNNNSDTLQATKNDPRKTRLGEFLRKSNIDELPQFVNVLLGNMSVVGPRPHMLKHTEEYSQMINKYMVRHLVKPGVTGWAQVTGFRGETHELWQMEGRVERDIWYLEHWTFMLDLYIIYRTVKNILKGEKEAY